MTTLPPLRRALVDLPVNTSTPPNLHPRGSNKKPQTGQKRPHWAIDDPENRVPAIHVRSNSEKGVPSPKKADKVAKIGAMDPPPCSPLTDPSSKPDRDDDESVASTPVFDPDESANSQATAATEVTQSHSQLQALRRISVSQHAETLRLRLQLAQYKVRTNQIDVPFSQLRMTSSSCAPSQHTATHRPSASTNNKAEEEPRLPELLPPPVLKPTSRTVKLMPSSRSGEEVERRRSREVIEELGEAEGKQEKENFRTPALPARHGERGHEEGSPTRARGGEKLTSSAIKGDAAMSLLGLRGQA